MYCGLFPGTEIDRQASAVFGMVFGEMDSFLSLLLTDRLCIFERIQRRFLVFLPTQTQPTKSRVEGTSHMHSVYFYVQMHLLDVSLTWLSSGAIFSSLTVYGQGAIPVSVCEQPSPGPGCWHRAQRGRVLPPCPPEGPGGAG